MSAAPKLAATTVPAPQRRPRPADRVQAPPLAHRLAARVGHQWLPRLAWSVGRTGRTGLVGIALLVAAALFLLSTHLQVAAEVEGLRADLATAQGRARGPAAGEGPSAAASLPALPARGDMPELLRRLFETATRERLAIDTGKFEVNATRASGLVRHQVSFPVTGPYPQVRAFIDTTLETMPAVALAELGLARKSISDGAVEAQIRMTVYTTATGARAVPGAGASAAEPASRSATRGAEARLASARVVEPIHASDLFAAHSWYVRPPPPPPARPPPPPPAPEPTAPPFPYKFVGSYAPVGEPPVYFLTRGDRVVDARVGDRLDGVYQFESAAGGQLVFLYLPLNVRQNVQAGGSR